jgi:hypothetical protein
MELLQTDRRADVFNIAPEEVKPPKYFTGGVLLTNGRSGRARRDFKKPLLAEDI